MKSQDTSPVWNATCLTNQYLSWNLERFLENDSMILLCSIPVAVPRWSHAVETPVEGAVSVNAQVRQDITVH